MRSIHAASPECRAMDIRNTTAMNTVRAMTRYKDRTGAVNTRLAGPGSSVVIGDVTELAGGQDSGQQHADRVVPAGQRRPYHINHITRFKHEPCAQKHSRWRTGFELEHGD